METYLADNHPTVPYTHINIKELKNIKHIKAYGIETTPTTVVWDTEDDEELVRVTGFTESNAYAIDELVDLI